MSFEFLYFPWQRRNLWRYAAFYGSVSAAIWTVGLGEAHHLTHVLLWELVPVGAAITAIILLVPVLFFRWVRRRVDRLHGRFTAPAVLESEAMVLIGNWQAPGLVRLEADGLVLAQSGGKTAEVPLSETLVCLEQRRFNGKLLWGSSRCFVLLTAERQSLAFAVADPSLWREALKPAHP